MTNREWLGTLSNEEFVEWVLNDYKTMWLYARGYKIEWSRLPQSYSPTVAEIVSSTTDAKITLKEWLNEEREKI